MELLNNILVALTTENEALIKFLSVPLLLIEQTLNMFLFLTVLNINSTKQNRIIYLSITVPLGIFCTLFIPKPYSNIITLIAAPIIIMKLFGISFLRSLLAEFVPIVFITIFELIITRLFLVLFGCSYDTCAKVPIFRISSTLLIYLLIFSLYKILKH